MKDSELLKLCNEYISYNPETGAICWKKRPAHSSIKLNIPIISKDKDGYLRLQLKGKTHKQHRLSFLIYHKYLPLYPQYEIDHDNRIKDDNRILNLRIASAVQNGSNQGLSKANTSGYKGVMWFKRDSNWKAKIVVNGTAKHLGYFNCKHSAAKAYNSAALKYHGKFAYLNEVAI